MLELHYDEVHTAEWLKRHNGRDAKVPVRNSEFKIFGKAVSLHRTPLAQRLTLPPEVKHILRTPSDESRWDKLESLRAVVVSELEGERGIILTVEEDIEKLARAVEACQSDVSDEVGPGSLVPAGCRVCFELPAHIFAQGVDKVRQEIALKTL